MRSHPSLILLVGKPCWRLGLCVAVVVSCDRCLVWWGVAVVSSRRAGRVRVGLLPLIHGESVVAICCEKIRRLVQR
jgi:hypothetical protein